jgi:hypothetical protein
MGTECWVFIDDIIIFIQMAEHAQCVAHVLERFKRANLQLHREKCIFAQDKFQYLDHVKSREGIHPCPKKVKAVQNYPVPQTKK